MGGPVNGVAQPTECVPDPSAEVAVTQPIRVTGPGRKPKFREEDVLREAMAMGLDCFTLTGIAERLGVVTSALYRLFPNRDMVVERCLQQVIAECRTPSPDMTWQDTLRLWGSEIWRLIGTFDGLAVIIMKYEYSGWLISNLWTAYTESLLASGRTRGQVIFALRIIADIDIGAGLRTEGARAPSSSVIRGTGGGRNATGAASRSRTCGPPRRACSRRSRSSSKGSSATGRRLTTWRSTRAESRCRPAHVGADQRRPASGRGPYGAVTRGPAAWDAGGRPTRPSASGDGWASGT